MTIPKIKITGEYEGEFEPGDYELWTLLPNEIIHRLNDLELIGINQSGLYIGIQYVPHSDGDTIQILKTSETDYFQKEPSGTIVVNKYGEICEVADYKKYKKVLGVNIWEHKLEDIVKLLKV